MGISDMMPACQLYDSVEGGLRKGTMVSASTCLGEKAVHASCADAGQFSSGVSLVPVNLPPLCWSSVGASLSKSVCGPFKRFCLRCQKFLPSIALILTGFYSQKLLLYPAKLSFRIEGHFKSFPDKTKLKEYCMKPVLYEMLNDLL
ncbi:hypothetical protein HJG60_010513 [Phyllostomus discolor]|uniref:L1 transposable element dsRBD-like domain-containing protein n=1 Tax=Phyllostomus discolor TaxID=89673 RepID=A0A834EEV1_9CHIR|nr:hypothetical protein HJG60_010513 [Phyllostomus discolor]